MQLFLTIIFRSQAESGNEQLGIKVTNKDGTKESPLAFRRGMNFCSVLKSTVVRVMINTEVRVFNLFKNLLPQGNAP